MFSSWLQQTPECQTNRKYFIISVGKTIKLKVDDVELLIRHSYWGNSVCFPKPATPSKLQGRLNLVRINCCFKNTRHLTQTKGKGFYQSEALLLKECKRGFISQSKHLAYKVKLFRIPYLGLFYVTFYSNKVKAKRELELEKRLKTKDDEVGLLLQHLYDYNSV